MSSTTVNDASSVTFAQLSAERAEHHVDKLAKMPDQHWFYGGMSSDLPLSHRASALQRTLDEWPIFGVSVFAFGALDTWVLAGLFSTPDLSPLQGTLGFLTGAAVFVLVAVVAHRLRNILLDGAYATIEGDRSWTLLSYFRTAKQSLRQSEAAGVPAATDVLAAVSSFTLDFEQLLEQASRLDRAACDTGYIGADYRATLVPLRDELLTFAAATVADVETAARLMFNARPGHLVPVSDRGAVPFTLAFDDQAGARIVAAREQLAAMFPDQG